MCPAHTHTHTWDLTRTRPVHTASRPTGWPFDRNLLPELFYHAASRTQPSRLQALSSSQMPGCPFGFGAEDAEDIENDHEEGCECCDWTSMSVEPDSSLQPMPVEGSDNSEADTIPDMCPGSALLQPPTGTCQRKPPKKKKVGGKLRCVSQERAQSKEGWRSKRKSSQTSRLSLAQHSCGGGDGGGGVPIFSRCMAAYTLR